MNRLAKYILSVACLIFLVGCGKTDVKNENIIEISDTSINQAQKVTVKRGDLQEASYYDAFVGPKVLQLSFSKEGTFGEWMVALGDKVHKGQVLATTSTKNLDKDIEYNKKEIDKIKKLYEYRKSSIENEKAIVTIQLQEVYKQIEGLQYLSEEYTQACMEAGNFDQRLKYLELEKKQLKERYELELPHEEEQLAKMLSSKAGNNIVAPFDGVIVAKEDAEYGDDIDIRTFYVAIADTSVLYARCERLSNFVLKKYNKALFWKDGVEYDATYIPIDADYLMITQNNKETAYSEFEISCENEDVISGAYGKLKLIQDEKKNVLYIPENTVKYMGGTSYVYREKGASYEKVNIKTGINDGLRFEVIEGLNEGDVIYVQE